MTTDTATRSGGRALRHYGPVQMAERFGMPRWQIERALTAGLIPQPDVKGSRWSAAVVEAATEKLEEIRAAVGSVPDVGAYRAAEYLSQRFNCDVEPFVLIELARQGLVPEVGEYKGHPLYCGRALEKFTSGRALNQAVYNGRLLTAKQAAAHLKIRPADFAHLARAGWIEPVRYAHGPYQCRRSTPNVPLYRVGDLDVLAEHPAIDWAAVRATLAGRPSPLARLTAGRRGTA